MAVNFNIRKRSYGDVFIQKLSYKPVKISESLFEKVLGRGNWKIERRINDLIEKDPWLKSNVTGEENMFSFSQNDYFPVYVESCSGYTPNRYCTAIQVVKLRYELVH